MKETPQRLRSFAPPTRDKIIIWCAVIAGCGMMALLGRTAAIHHFGTDEFRTNCKKKYAEKPAHTCISGLYVGSKFFSVKKQRFVRLIAKKYADSVAASCKPVNLQC